MKYTIPLIPPSENKFKGRQNYQEYRKLKKQWADIVAVYCRPRPVKPIEKCILTLTYFFPTKTKHDPNNYSGQFITDGLVNAGIIKDDSFYEIELRIKGDYDKQNPRTEIEVREV